jgi:hypothetical protein
MKVAALAALCLIMSGSALAKDPDCTGPHRWPAIMAQTQMGTSDALRADVKTTTVTRINSQKIGPDLFLQVHLVRYVMKNGEVARAITVSDASNEECSGDHFEVYPVWEKVTINPKDRLEFEPPSKREDSHCPSPLPAQVAQRWLTDAGVVEAGQLDSTEAILTKISSQKIGKNLFRQVHLVILAKKSGQAVEAVAVADVSTRECRVAKVEVYLVAPQQ